MDTHLKDGLRGSSGGTQIINSTKYTTAGNQTIYAQWQIKTYQVTYNANNGTGEPGVQTKTWGQTLQLSGTKPTRSGYTFVNWNTQANGTGTSYNPGANYTINAPLTLYAQWKQNPVLATTAIKPANYGDSVNYSAGGISDWKVFLNDGTNIYIISSDYAPYDSLKTDDGLTEYVSQGEYKPSSVNPKSAKALNEWLNKDYCWYHFASGAMGRSASSGPTLTQFWQSYNAKYSTNFSGTDGPEGLNVEDTLYFSKSNTAYGYWLKSNTSSSTVRYSMFKFVTSGGYIFSEYDGSSTTTKDMHGVRPLICLKPNIYAIKENNKWTFSE